MIAELYGRNYLFLPQHPVDALIEDLEKVLPCVRLKKNLDLASDVFGRATPSFQAVLDYLMEHGLLSATALERFRCLHGIEFLDLTESLKSESFLGLPSSRIDLFKGICLVFVITST